MKERFEKIDATILGVYYTKDKAKSSEKEARRLGCKGVRIIKRNGAFGLFSKEVSLKYLEKFGDDMPQ
jgi:hypothetical protein